MSAGKNLLLSLGAVLSATGVFASWLCCLLPVALGAMGAGTAALGTKLEPYRPILTGLTVLFLAGAFFQAYRPLRTTCEGEACRVPGRSRWHRIALWTAALLALSLMGAPYWMGLLSQWML